MAGEREVVQIQDFFFVGSHEKSALFSGADLLAVRCREGGGLPKNSFQGWKLLEVDPKKINQPHFMQGTYYIQYNIYICIYWIWPPPCNSGK